MTHNEDIQLIEFLENIPDYIPTISPYTIRLLNENSNSIMRQWCLEHCVYTAKDCLKMSLNDLLSFAHKMTVIMTEEEFDNYIVPKCEFSVDENYLRNQMLL